MKMQLRTYTINRGCLDDWVAEWEEKIKPLRLKLGFSIAGAWIVAETNHFVWILRYDGKEDWETLDKVFHQSEERRAMQPDPARHIARMEHYFLTPV